QQGRQQAAQATHVELREAQPPGVRHLLHQQAGDQETRQYEKHVHADEAAAQPRHTSVHRHDQQDGHGAQAFQIGAVTQPVIVSPHRPFPAPSRMRTPRWYKQDGTRWRWPPDRPPRAMVDGNANLTLSYPPVLLLLPGTVKQNQPWILFACRCGWHWLGACAA